MKAFIQLGKIGDVLSILAILQHEAEVQKCRIPLVIAKEYASILEGVSYVEPVLWKGDAGDVAGAIMFAKKRYSQVVVLQSWGNVPTQHLTPSFQFDQWKRGGALPFFDEWPLVFDKRDEARERQLIADIEFKGEQPFILFADHSQSSPFMHKEELFQLLKTACLAHEPFPMKVVRLSEIKTPKIYDLLGLYDKAVCLVTVETSHLHLSRASKVPTIALCTSGWRGSAFSKRFKFFMRYPEWDSRKQDLIEAVRTAIGAKGCRIPPPVVTMDTIDRHGYNFAWTMHEGKQVNCYRAHMSGDWKTKLFLNGNELRLPARYKDFSHEDLRFFEFNGKLHGVYVMSTTIDNFFRCYVAYGEIRGNEIDHIQINHPENNLMGMTKNFVPFVHENRLMFIYGIKGNNQIVLEVDGNRVVSEFKAPAPAWSFGEIRGGCLIPHAGAYLRFFHSRAQYSDKTQRYFIGASIIEAKPPFKTLAVSKRPILQGDERYTPNCHHWKPNCALPYGVIEQDGKFLLSFGRNDCECCIAELTTDDLNL